ncbi:HAD family hydrolase [Bacillus marasmi]|uniref:HAD family hydrolase n=1 Tax=Bacillus marasmi TaxID=1926279 RepID=UPI0011CB89DC|nr:HAD family phosphatase [Bacillus marasmi]
MDKAFIFDMDGVIINSEPMHEKIELSVAAEQGIELEDDNLEKYVGMRSRDMWESIIAERNFKVDVNVILNVAEQRKVQYIDTHDIEPIEGIKDLLEHLSKLRYRIALASSSSKPFIEAVLNKFEITHFFEEIVSGDDIKEGKPAPDIYLEVARRLGINPGSCLVLEDSENGVKAGNTAGMKTIGFTNPESGNMNLSEAKNIVKSIHDVLKLI